MAAKNRCSLSGTTIKLTVVHYYKIPNFLLWYLFIMLQRSDVTLAYLTSDWTWLQPIDKCSYWFRVHPSSADFSSGLWGSLEREVGYTLDKSPAHHGVNNYLTPALWAENKIVSTSLVIHLTAHISDTWFPQHPQSLSEWSPSQLSSPNFKHTCLFMPISKTQHYYLLGRSTFWWPRSQSHFNVVISYASLVAKRWSPKSQHPIRLHVCGWRR